MLLIPWKIHDSSRMTQLLLKMPLPREYNTDRHARTVLQVQTETNPKSEKVAHNSLGYNLIDIPNTSKGYKLP